MYLLDLISLTFNVQACDLDLCPGSAFNSITAALTAQGYYKQADLLYYITQSELGSLTSLIYAISAFAGIVSMVLGTPPRNYMWFFLGPAVYSFLVTSTYFAAGVRWMDLQQGLTPANQAEVWRIAEPGLRNNGYIIRNGLTVNSQTPPSGPAQVSYFFVWIDYFFSSLMEQLIPLTGIYYLEEGQGNDSNIDKLEGAEANRNWSILTDDKWTKVLDITDAHLSNVMIRRSFIDFLAGECGDVYNGQIDNALWLAATKGHGERIPYSVFKGDKVNGSNSTGQDEEKRALMLRNALSAEAIPIPESLVTLLVSGEGSFAGGSFLESNSDTKKLLDQINSKNGEVFSGAITCDQYLRIIVHAFKYEAINIYSQIIDDAPGEFRNDPESVVRNLAYGWGISKLTPPPNSNMGKDDQKRQEYFVNLILVYLFRNELMIAPGPSEGDTADNLSSKRTQFYVDTQIRTVGSKTKYAEVYSWAKMMPYFQGIMMYVLAMAYPFVALMVIVPGWHKIIVTWITFWIWVKTWDLGFAIVKVLERSIWAMLGNDPSAAYVNQYVLNVGAYMKYNVGCSNPAGGKLGNCNVPLITFEGNGGDGMDTIVNTFKALGRILGLAGNLNLDLTNSYYIYIMSALYFAVPGVTGQIVLGAKAGAANLVGGAIQGFGDANKGAAGAGSQSHLANAVQSNAASVGQASYAKASKGFAVDALASQNAAALAGIDSQAAGTTSQLAQGVLGGRERKNQSFNSAVNPAEIAGGWSKGAAVIGAQAALGSGNDSLAEKMKAADAKLQDILGGGASAPGASAPGGGGGSAPGGGAPGGATNSITGHAGKLIPYGGSNAAIAMAKNKMQQGYLQDANRVGAESNDRTISGFSDGAEQTRAQTQGQRLGGYANYRGETGAANASQAFANKVGAYSTIAAGTMGGSLVKPLPMATQDSAMSGILNSYSVNDAGQIQTDRNAAYTSGGFFAIGGGFDKNVSGHLGKMNTMNGQAVNNTFGGGYGGEHGTNVSDFNKAFKDSVLPK